MRRGAFVTLGKGEGKIEMLRLVVGNVVEEVVDVETEVKSWRRAL